MCTVREIQEPSANTANPRHDMESTEIDQVMRRLPLRHRAGRCFTRPPAPRPPYSWRSRKSAFGTYATLTAAVLF